MGDIARRKQNHDIKRIDENASTRSFVMETKTPRADVSGGAQSFTVDILRYALIGAQGQSETRAIPESRGIS
jgi:hypothetical protein